MVAGPEQIAEKLLPLAEAIANLRPDPRNARKHGDKNLAAVRSSLTRFGQVKPIVVDADGIVLAGNGTLEAAKALGWKRLAVVRVPLTGADARAYALADNRTAELAEWDWEELASQTRELGAEAMLDIGWDDADLSALLSADLEAPLVSAPRVPQLIGGASAVPPLPVAGVAGAPDAAAGPPAAEAPKKLYTTKADTPIYVPRGDCPDVAELVDRSKTLALLSEIEAAPIPDNIKAFLRCGAYRHDRFNFKLIAEFYAHADAEVQRLFENSALVIIDIDRAVELGFVELSATMQEIFESEFAQRPVAYSAGA